MMYEAICVGQYVEYKVGQHLHFMHISARVGIRVRPLVQRGTQGKIFERFIYGGSQQFSRVLYAISQVKMS